jgi:hypothetical protein
MDCQLSQYHKLVTATVDAKHVSLFLIRRLIYHQNVSLPGPEIGSGVMSGTNEKQSKIQIRES